MKIGIIAPDYLADLNRRILNRLDVDAVQIKHHGDFEGIDGLILSACLDKEIDQLIYTHQDALSHILQQQIGVMAIGNGIKFLAQGSIFNIMGIEVSSQYKLIPETIFVSIPTMEQSRLTSVCLNHISISAVDPNIGILSKDKIRGPLIVRQGNYIACTFTVELSSDYCLYQYFKKIICDTKDSQENTQIC